MGNGFRHKVHILYTLSTATTVSVPSPELGPPPLSRKRVCPPPMNKRDSPAGEGVGESQFGLLAICVYSVASTVQAEIHIVLSSFFPVLALDCERNPPADCYINLLCNISNNFRA